MKKKVYSLCPLILTVLLPLLIFAGKTGAAPQEQKEDESSYSAATSVENRQDLANPIVARVNGTGITRRTLFEMMAQMGSNKGPLSAEGEAAFRKSALDKAILEELVYQQAVKEGIKADPKAVEMKLNDLRVSTGGPERFAEILKKNHMTEEDLKVSLARDMVVGQIVTKEVINKAAISEADIEREYNLQKNKFVQAERIIATDVVFFLDPEDGPSVARVEKVLQSILKEKDKNPWSLHPDGTFIVRDIEISKSKEKELYDEAMKLKVGELSGVIKTSDSIHLIKLKEYSPAKEYSLQEMRGFLDDKLRGEARQKRLDEWEAELRKGAQIEILDKGTVVAQ